MTPEVVIFVSTYNRVSFLERTILSYRKFTVPYEVCVIDNGTDNPEALETLRRISKYPEIGWVYRLPRVYTMQQLTDHINIAVKDYWENTSIPWFAVTDPDVSFEKSHPDTLARYLELAEHLECSVGCHLRVDGSIPVGYPLRSRVLAVESLQLYKSKQQNQLGIYFSSRPIDTTFHVFERTNEFKRLQMETVRVCQPYDAIHLDWYVDIFNPQKEYEIYMNRTGAMGVGSWGADWIKGFWCRYMEYGPEESLRIMLGSHTDRTDICVNSILISWLYQYGIAENNPVLARRWLRNAIPSNSPSWEHRRDWEQMVFNSNFSSLGWL